MNKLKQNDSLIKPTPKQIQQIIDAVDGKYLPLPPELFINKSIKMGGLFWSDRKNMLISGVIGGANKYGFDEFLERLKNTVA